MPKPPKIPKEAILDAALQILIRDGFSNVNIKTIAKELNCSTQPISWHFGNMEQLRIALGAYAYQYADTKTAPPADCNPSSLKSPGLYAFDQVGRALINLAFDEPNLYRFLFLDGSSGYCIGGVEALTQLSDNKELIDIISKENDFTESFAAQYMESMIIYTMGILSLCVSGVMHCDKETVHEKIDLAGNTFLNQYTQ